MTHKSLPGSILRGVDLDSGMGVGPIGNMTPVGVVVAKKGRLCLFLAGDTFPFYRASCEHSAMVPARLLAICCVVES